MLCGRIADFGLVLPLFLKTFVRIIRCSYREIYNQNCNTMTYDQMTRSANLVLVEFFATWCGHCRNMEPIVEQIGEMLKGKVEIVQLDIDTNEEAAESENVTGTPTFILYKDGRQVWRSSGEMPGEILLNTITSYM